MYNIQLDLSASWQLNWIAGRHGRNVELEVVGAWELLWFPHLIRFTVLLHLRLPGS